MPYNSPRGYKRVWTYLLLPYRDAMRVLAVRHRRYLWQEIGVAIEQYVERETQGAGAKHVETWKAVQESRQ